MSRRAAWFTLVPMAALLAAGCDPPAAADPAAAEQVRAATSAYTASLPVGADSTASFFADSGTMLGAGMAPVIGRKAIGEWLAPLFRQYEVREAGEVVQAVDVSGNAATVWGTYSQTVAPRGGGESQAHTGRFVAAWKKRGDGRWRINLMITQPDPPPSQPAAAPKKSSPPPPADSPSRPR